MKGEYNDENFRFTTKDNSIYTIQMGWAGSEKEVLIKSLSKSKLKETNITKVSVLDSSETIKWEVTEEGLKVITPFKASNKTAICYKIETEKGWGSMEYDVAPLDKEPFEIDGE